MSAAPASIEITLVTLVIAGVIGFGLFVLISEKGKALFPDDYGRKWLAWAVFASTLSALRKFFIYWDLNSFAVWLLALVVFGGIAYILGLIIGRLIRYGKKSNVASSEPNPKVEDPKNNMTNEGGFSATQYKHTPKILPDDALYEMAWKEMETDKGDRGLWAKAYAICDGEMEKTRAYYIRERVKFLQGIQQKRLDEYKTKREEELGNDTHRRSISNNGGEIVKNGRSLSWAKNRHGSRAPQKNHHPVMWGSFVVIALVAIWWANLSLNTNPSDPQDQFDLAVRYMNGDGVPENSSEAMKLYRKAADQGFAKAQKKLGFAYYLGRHLSKNYAEAVYWFRKLAEQEDATAYHYLGEIYAAGGYGVLRSESEAVKWWRKAAAGRGAAAISFFRLGISYRDGKGVPQNYVKAVEWFRKSELSYAYYELGAAYYDGLGVSKNHAEAVKWWRKAAADDNPFSTEGRSAALEKLKQLGIR